MALTQARRIEQWESRLLVYSRPRFDTWDHLGILSQLGVSPEYRDRSKPEHIWVAQIYKQNHQRLVHARHVLYHLSNISGPMNINRNCIMLRERSQAQRLHISSFHLSDILENNTGTKKFHVGCQ